jgi:hypothetical protein
VSARLTRRALLRGAGGAALALPLLESLGCSGPTRAPAAERRDALTFPRRIVFVYMPNGNLDVPATMSFGGTQLEALQPFAAKMVLIRGLDLLANDVGPGEPHQQGMAVLTGRQLNTGTQVGGDGSLAGWASGISLDQHLGNTIGGGTRFKALNLGVQSTQYGGTEVRTVLSYAGNDQPVANETSPWALYNRVFASLGADPLGLQRQLERRHAAMAFARDRFARVLPRLSRADQLKLEQHLDAVRDVETRLDVPGASIGGSCARPTLPSPVPLTDPESYPALSRLMIDQTAMALACDLTRVVTLQFSASTNNRPYPWLSYDAGSGPQPITDDEHLLGHQPDTDTVAWGKIDVIRRWYMGELAYLLGKLDAVPEGAGTLLDNTVVVWLSEIARGNSHSHKNVPFMLAGSCGGAIATNRVLEVAGETPHNNLLVSLMNAMGVAGSTFGDPAFCTGPLTGLL